MIESLEAQLAKLRSRLAVTNGALYWNPACSAAEEARELWKWTTEGRLAPAEAWTLIRATPRQAAYLRARAGRDVQTRKLVERALEYRREVWREYLGRARRARRKGCEVS